jgi:GTP-binding protein
MKHLPKIVIVGRANVGKSMLFNRLSTRVKSLTFDYEGVTRDFISDEILWKGHRFELVDTGGIRTRSSITIDKEVSDRAKAQIAQAAAIIFVVDGAMGLVPEDREIAKFLYKAGKPVVVAINKIDKSEWREHQYEWDSLGFAAHVGVSATHGTAVEDLMEAVIDHTQQVSKKEQLADNTQYKVIILGKPNVGKSSLMNLLLHKERSIVSDVAGTTREAIKDKVRFESQEIALTDTPGIRRKRSVDEPLETLMVKSAFAAMRQADIVLLVLDASQGTLSDQELKLAFYAFEHGKALIILFNKQDLVTSEQSAELTVEMKQYAHLIKKVETLSISCLTGKNVGKILSLVQKVWERHSQKLSDEQLTMLFSEELTRRPIFHNMQQLLVSRARQIKEAPITITVTVNHPRFFGKSHCAYLENIMRSHFELKGVPVLFVVSKHKG